ncbi:MAG: DUF4440 domain-containing protein [Gemmatimonadetes bacterium]|nr:DUF4440 domain-containing protein [Gemmatimonadota bacterium]
MRVLITLVWITALAAPASALQENRSPLPSVTLPAELQRVLTDYEVAWQARDATALAALFADDGFVMAPGRPPARGLAAIRTYYTGRGGPLSLRALGFAAEGSIGWIIGGYARARDEPDIGKFSLTLRKNADGRWLIVTDMDNGNS